ncbi:hypothetical protein DFH09DRAFT_1179296, partial [Mycena vulgaris]
MPKWLRVPPRGKEKPPWLKSLPQLASQTLPDVLSTSMHALKESADFNPLLKSTVGAALAVWDIAERAKRSKADARNIALRTEAILKVVADAVPVGSKVPPPMVQSIERFTVQLDGVWRRMDKMALTSRFSRVIHLNSNEGVLSAIKAELDDAYRDMLAASALRLELQQAQLAVQQVELAVQQAQMHVDVKKVAASTDILLYCSGFTVFFGQPL